jgi:hypothetical protein
MEQRSEEARNLTGFDIPAGEEILVEWVVNYPVGDGETYTGWAITSCAAKVAHDYFKSQKDATPPTE